MEKIKLPEQYQMSPLTAILIEASEVEWDGKLILLPDGEMYKWVEVHPETPGPEEYWLMKYDPVEKRVSDTKPAFITKHPLTLFAAQPFPVVQEKKHIITLDKE